MKSCKPKKIKTKNYQNARSIEEKMKTTNGKILKLKFNTDRYGKSKTLETYESRLPPEVSTQIEGSTLIIKNPEEYRKFMNRASKKKSLLSRLFTK